ncbi:MAG: response regulator transcription factor [Sphingobacteriaceae bacterium]|nr:response regulator transcription factor [Cytophagaceae bacterium]
MTEVKKLRCLAVDDEPLALDVLRTYIAKLPTLELVATCGNALEALAYLQRGDVDLLFLDIQMPDLTGMQFLRVLNGRCPVILTTAYPQYALEGYEYEVLDYLLKPIPFERFVKAVQRAQANRPFADRTEPLVSPPPSITPPPVSGPDAADFMFVKTENRLLKINLSAVLYVEGLKDYVSIFTKTERILSLQTMGKMQESLPPARFVRVHKSYIVALDHIERIERQRIYLGKAVIPIGDTYLKDFMQRVQAQ